MAYENKTGLPSVTEILSPYIDMDYFTEESREKGSAVHAAITAHLQGLWVKPLQPDWQPYFDSFKRWADIAIDSVILVEKRLIDPDLGFCGQPDIILKLKGDDKNTLADWKTSQTFYLWWILQGCAYRHLAKKDKNIETKKQLSVILKKDGSGCLVRSYDNFRYYFNIFVGILNAFKYFRKE